MKLVICRGAGFLLALFLAAGGMASSASAQTNPVPFLDDQPLIPTSAAPGAPGFTLTVEGTGFVSGSVVRWNGAALATSFVSASRLMATVPASEVATAGTASVTVLNPAPGGGLSSPAFFYITNPEAAPAFVAFSPSACSSIGSGYIVADFNGDGKLDLATTTNPQGAPENLCILLGKGDGTFSPPIYTAAPTAFGPIVAGDFNGDGKVDVAFQSGAGSISILLGNGDGTFQPPLTATFTENSGSADVEAIIAADFNGDGKLDLALLLIQANTIQIMLGNGDGTFRSLPQFAAAIPGVLFPLTMITGDFNGDGKLDLAVPLLEANMNGDCCVSLFLGNGDGTFGPALHLATPISSESVLDIVAADVNKDGKLDLITLPGFSGASAIQVSLGNGDGTFQAPVSYPTGGTDAHQVGVIDLNGDGNLDLVAFDFASSRLFVLLGNGDGTFQTPLTYPFAGAFDFFGDFNGDGKPDLGFGFDPSVSGSSVTLLLQGASPVVSASPFSLDYAAQAVGTASPAQTVTLTNTGTTTASLSNIGFTGANAGDFAQTNTCGPSLAPQAKCQVNVTFTPMGGGARAAAISITDNALGSPQTVPLTGIAQDFSMGDATPTSTMATVAPGQVASFGLLVAPQNGFSQPVAFTCTGAPMLSSCMVSPNPAPVNVSASGVVTITVVTTAPSLLAPESPVNLPGSRDRNFRAIPVLGLLALALLANLVGRRGARRPGLAYSFAFVLLAWAGTIMTGCGGGSTATMTNRNPGTPAGTYTLMVVGTSTQGSPTLTHNFSLTLVVE